ncbi:MAG: hypothetical protein AAGJ08_27305 [Cyanobacteria bacterium P01_H01_bin.35]
MAQKLDFWKNYLEEASKKNKKVAVRDSGFKCFSFLTTLDTIDKINKDYQP